MLTAKTFTGEMLGNLTGANIPSVYEREASTNQASTFMCLAQKTEELRIEVKDCFSGFKRFKPNATQTLQRKLGGFDTVIRLELTGLTYMGTVESLALKEKKLWR